MQLLWLAVIENFGYRQLSTFWRARGLWSALRGKAAWGKMDRKGFSVDAGQNNQDTARLTA